jgi:hypothetical protein
MWMPVQATPNMKWVLVAVTWDDSVSAAHDTGDENHGHPGRTQFYFHYRLQAVTTN